MRRGSRKGFDADFHTDQLLEAVHPYHQQADLTDEGKRCLGSLAEFIRQGWHVLEEETPLEWNWHIDAIADHVQATLEDWMAVQRWRQRQDAAQRAGKPFTEEQPVQRIQNELINVPPGTAKSRIVSVCATAWMWAKWPSWRVICLSSNPRVALRDSDFTRILIESEWFQETFKSTWTLSKDQKAKSLFRNSAGGSRAAFGWFAKITGDRADALIIDDPHDAEEVKSEKQRLRVIHRYDSAIANRLNDLRTSVRIAVMQRVHEADFSGHVLAQGGWDHLCIPMEHEPARYGAAKHGIPRQTAIGWIDPRTVAGELLFPVRFPASVLAVERTRLGSAGYAGQHQQRPSPADGDIFKASYFTLRYRRLPELVEVWTCWDTAQTEKEQNAESACVVVGLGADGLLYLLEAAHGRWETPDLAKFFVARAKWFRGLYGDRYRGDYVEAKANAPTLIQYLRRTDPDLVVIGIQVEADKESRARGVTPLCEAGRIVFPDVEIFPRTAGWSGDLMDQLLNFPNGSLKDLVDAFVYCLKRLMGTLGKKKARRGGGGQQ